MADKKKVLPRRDEDFSAWYHTLVKKANLIEESPVRGCMILKPYAFALWERMKETLDQAFKSTGHQNAYFPLFIPLSHLSKEADHVEGFAKECAVVTHYRLTTDEKGKIIPDPTASLEEPLVVRPTSETSIWHTYSKWIQSYRDLPLLINQWANVVRWEMRTRPFLRTAEILWQEGHTAHASAQEAQAEARQMHDIYASFVAEYLAIPAIKGEKTEHERFAGALNTYTLEALMQDGKALQLGTSHFLGQNFSKAFNVRYSDPEGAMQYPHGTSWGVTTRLIGAMIMTHSDDHGLVIPPKIAPIQTIILPLYKKNQDNAAITSHAESLHALLQKHDIRSRIDSNEFQTPGWKFTQYELQGIPLRLSIGPRDIAAGTVEVYRRDTREKIHVSRENLIPTLQKLLYNIQKDLLDKATAFREAHTTTVEDYPSFQEVLKRPIPGFIHAYWDGTTSTEKKIQQATQATIRCIPQEKIAATPGTCIYTQKKSTQKVIFAKAY